MKKFRKQPGFSILEIVVVTFIITMGLVGVLSLIVQNIQAQNIKKNELVAAQLAQEGLELVRNIRDTNWITPGNAWDEDISNGLTYLFSIDYRGRSTILEISGIDDPNANLKKDINNFYSYDTGTDTIFNRMITVIDNLDYLEVESRVQWPERSNINNYVVSTILYNWR